VLNVAAALSDHCMFDAGLFVCGDYVQIGQSGIDTSWSCTYNALDGGLVASDWFVNTSDCTMGSVSCTSWVPASCAEAGAADGAADAPSE